jgi:hypothetical protein
MKRTAMVGIVLALAFLPALASAEPFEPNETYLQASAAPLGAGGTGGRIDAALETSADIDFYKFYVAARGAQESFAVTNLVPSADPLNSFYFNIYDPTGSPVPGSHLVLINSGSASPVLSLAPGKYIISLASQAWTHSTPYSVNANGVFASYADVRHKCARYRAASRKLKRRHIDGSRQKKARGRAKLYCSIRP